MLKKTVGAALIALAVATTASVPVQAAPASAESARIAGFTLLKEKTGLNGRTIRLWKNDGNGLYHAQLLRGVKGDHLHVTACYDTSPTSYKCVSDTKYSNGEPDLNTSEMWGHSPSATVFVPGSGDDLTVFG